MASSESSSPFRLVDFRNPDDFIEAVKNYDDSFMNFALGALLDSVNPSQAAAQARWGGGPRTLLAIYRGDDLL